MPTMIDSLKPWFAVATPHEDIRKGRLSEAVFAANIWAVAQGTAPDLYLDPESFFSKTYLTGGLKQILQRVGRSLAGDAEAGDRIFSLQTSFGGGKTHSLVALWHLAKHADKIRGSTDCAEVRKALEGCFPAKVKGVAVFTNQTCDPTQGRKTPEGVHTRTLWGELALQ
jgi:predicted AAA+ superfamily ATPase